MTTRGSSGVPRANPELNGIVSKLRTNLTQLGMNARYINTKIGELRTSASLNKRTYAQSILNGATKAAKAAKTAKAVKAVNVAGPSRAVKVRNNSINRKCNVDGSKMYYRISDIANVTVNKSPGMEAKFLFDTLKAIRGQCFTVHQQCKGMYPLVSGNEEGRQWLTSIDQDNDISLQHTLDKSDIPILYNTPRMCDPGITKSKNWSLKNYIQTRLFMYNNVFKKGKGIKGRNSTSCFNSVVFDFRPFVYSMEHNGKKIYITQWMTINPNSEYGYTPNIAISESDLRKQIDTRKFFEELVVNYSKKKMQKSPTQFNNSHPLQLDDGNDLQNFIKFINDYEGVGFAGVSNTNGNLPVSNITGIPNIKIEDDILRMFYFDLQHDLGNKSSGFGKTTFAMFSLNFINELESLKGSHSINKWPGAGTVGVSYDKYGTTIAKKTNNRNNSVNNVIEIPAIFKTIGDLSQYIYAAKYNTTVASGDRMGIAVGLYVCAKMGRPVKCMIEDGITGFVLYTGRDTIKFTTKSSCRGGNRNGRACLRNTNTSINGSTIENRVRQFNSTIANQMDAIEARKPKLPPNMKSLVQLWSLGANVLNVQSIDSIMKIINDFQGYWSDTDLQRFIRIIKSLNNRQNINNSRRTKLAALNGQLRAYLKTNTPNK